MNELCVVIHDVIECPVLAYTRCLRIKDIVDEKDNPPDEPLDLPEGTRW